MNHISVEYATLAEFYY